MSNGEIFVNDLPAAYEADLSLSDKILLVDNGVLKVITIDEFYKDVIVRAKGEKGNIGPIGPQGPAGPQGPTGASGLSAYQIAIQNGFSGTQSEWLDTIQGVEGDSAYQVAIDNGFSGTAAQWLASLKGAAGTQGPTGASGQKGWSPLITIYTDTDTSDRYFYLSDWVGGEGTKPSLFGFITESGVSTDKLDATPVAPDLTEDILTIQDLIDALNSQTWKLQIGNGTAQSVEATDTIRFMAGQNIAITRSGDNITIALAGELPDQVSEIADIDGLQAALDSINTRLDNAGAYNPDPPEPPVWTPPDPPPFDVTDGALYHTAGTQTITLGSGFYSIVAGSAGSGVGNTVGGKSHVFKTDDTSVYFVDTSNSNEGQVNYAVSSGNAAADNIGGVGYMNENATPFIFTQAKDLNHGATAPFGYSGGSSGNVVVSNTIGVPSTLQITMLIGAKGTPNGDIPAGDGFVWIRRMGDYS